MPEKSADERRSITKSVILACCWCLRRRRLGRFRQIYSEHFMNQRAFEQHRASGTGFTGHATLWL